MLNLSVQGRVFVLNFAYLTTSMALLSCDMDRKSCPFAQKDAEGYLLRIERSCIQ